MSCTNKAFNYVQAAQNSKENGDAQKSWTQLCHQYADVLENDLMF